MAVITITRGMYSGGEAVAERIAKQLGARCVSGEVLLEAAKKYNVPEEKVAQVFENTPTFWERMTESRRIYLAYIQATLAEWSKEDNIVYHGNAGQELLRDVPHVLKVRLAYPIPYRIDRIMKQFGKTAEEAARQVEEIDESRSRRMRYFYNEDWRNVTRYDIAFYLEHISEPEAEEIILSLVKKPEFQLTEERKPAFQDFLIKTRVYALLAGALVGRLSLINVTVQEGVVTLQGTLTSNEGVVDQIVSEIEKLEGVKKVNNEIVVGLVYQEWNV